ncbi:MAG: SUMF1/EgtB/PvdO family nonheme iron enzyme [Acidobacteriota bacterium]
MRSTRILAFPFVLIALLAVGCGGSEAEADPEAEAADSAPAEPERPEAGSDESMVLIPGGEYTMGSDIRPRKMQDSPQWYEPPHTVSVDPYYVDVYEVTYWQFFRFDASEDREYKIKGDWRSYYQTGSEYYPVPNVVYDDAVAYCEWAGKRLPTEVEWEIAARGPEGFRFPWGQEWQPGLANTNEVGFANIQDVGIFSQDKSPFGVYDMLGNVQEWTSTRLRPYPRSPARKDGVFTQRLRAVRGASYAIKARDFGLYLRMGFLDNYQAGIGFRCAKDAEAEGEEGSSH